MAGSLSSKVGMLLIGALGLFVGSLPNAGAALTQLTVTLTDPTGLPPPGPHFSFSDTVSVVPGREIEPGNSTNIGSSNALLNHEFVDAQSANRIVLSLEAGADSKTGYGAGANYLFSNLAFSSPSVVTGVTVSLDNVSGVTLGDQVVFANGSIRVFVDTLTIPQFRNVPCDGVQCGTITLDLIVAQVPEPAMYVLLAIGLGTLLMRNSRRDR